MAKEPYKVPSWFMKIKPGAHGATPTQKRAWRIVSEYVRKRDFEKYKGKCVSCGKVFVQWEDLQAGHYKPWGSSNSWFKYDLTNINGQCNHCNMNSGADIGFCYGQEMKRRYGKNILAWIEKENEKYRGQKMEEWELVAMCEKLLSYD